MNRKEFIRTVFGTIVLCNSIILLAYVLGVLGMPLSERSINYDAVVVFINGVVVLIFGMLFYLIKDNK